MVNKCAVADCHSGRRKIQTQRKKMGLRPISLFNVPKSNQLRRQWETELQTTLRWGDCVCELHFAEQSVKRTDDVLLPDGTIHSLKRERYALNRGAVPIRHRRNEEVIIVDCVRTNEEMEVALPSCSHQQTSNLPPAILAIHTEHDYSRPNRPTNIQEQAETGSEKDPSLIDAIRQDSSTSIVLKLLLNDDVCVANHDLPPTQQDAIDEIGKLPEPLLKIKMAKLLSMEISGIRSFGPYDRDVQEIQFLSPLTLILGQNGCGKTTIIEAIRYVLTGDVPGGGQAFVNDPKMSGQIKLRFIDVRGNEVTICRMIEVRPLTNNSKNNTIKVKKLDGEETMSVPDDLETYCCEALNVSKGILNHVIFCHQEDSAWPLDEASKLKLKFDEIFNTEKYNKCIDLLRDEVKTKKREIERIHDALEYNKQMKEDVEKIKINLQEKKAKLQQLETSMFLKQAKRTPIKQRILDICEMENTLCQLQKELSVKEEAEKSVVAQQVTIRNSILFEFDGSDDELQRKIESFTNRSKRIDDLIKKQERQHLEVEKVIESVIQEIEKLQVKIGELNEEKRQYRIKCEERKHLIEKGKVEIKLSQTTITDYNKEESVKVVLSEMEMILQNSQELLADVQTRKDLEEQDLQKGIDRVREKYIRTKQCIQLKKNDLNEFKRKVTDITNNLAKMSTSDKGLKDVCQKIETYEKTLSKLRDEVKLNELTNSIIAAQNLIDANERRIDSLRQEYRILNRNHIIEVKIDLEKQWIVQKQLQINEIKNKNYDSLKELFGDEIPPVQNLKNTIQDILSTNNKMENDLNMKIKEHKQVEIEKINCTKDIANCKSKIESGKNQIFEYCLDRPLPGVLDECSKKKDKLQKDKGQLSAVKNMYEKFINEFVDKDKPCCPVCQTGFNGNAVKQIVDTMKMKIGKIPQELELIELELNGQENLYNKLQQLQPLNETIELLVNVDLKLLKTKLTTLTQQFDDKSKELAEFLVSSKTLQRKIEICTKIIADAALLDQYHSDMVISERNITTLKDQLVCINNSKNREEIESEIDSLSGDNSTVKRIVEIHRNKIDKYNARSQELMNKISLELQKKIQKLQMGTRQMRPYLEQEKSELLGKIDSLKTEIVELNSNFVAFELELNDAVESRNRAIAVNKNAVDTQRNELMRLQTFIGDIKHVQRDIDVYLSKKIDVNLSAASSELANFCTEETQLNELKNIVLDRISKKKEQKIQQDLEYHTLKDNVLLRDKLKVQNQLKEEVVVLKWKVSGHDYKNVLAEKQELTKTKETLEKEINLLTGQKNELKLVINELRCDLVKPEKKRVYKEYQTKFYELKVLEHSIKDLMKYISALEKSILQSNKSRIMEINKTIRELWRDIYRGNDIDYIEIKTEKNSDTASKLTYKVVQVRNGVDIDMRHRCSAGQKILACLIIRIALSQTFSASCGILALDEPTTNLDRENVSSLSDALSRIVSNRRKQRHFQLLVITHDEEFIENLIRMHNVMYYQRVIRDDQGFSKITREIIN